MPLPGSELICSFVSWQRSVLWDNDGARLREALRPGKQVAKVIRYGHLTLGRIPGKVIWTNVVNHGGYFNIDNNKDEKK